MADFDAVLREMDFAFIGEGRFKITADRLLEGPDTILVDLRSDEERAIIDLRPEELLKTISLPLDELPERLSEIPRDKTVGLFCSSHTRSTMAYFYLRAHGYENAKILLSGYDALLPELTPGKLSRRLRARRG
ncbi:MAG: rhodanese-like domain-containing protein [Candidatus Eisenbacteria bacterium]|nr:rhodanese-like domain-containing protein [Candidatus Eisenbacteria bacterium]